MRANILIRHSTTCNIIITHQIIVIIDIINVYVQYNWNSTLLNVTIFFVDNMSTVSSRALKRFRSLATKAECEPVSTINASTFLPDIRGDIDDDQEDDLGCIPIATTPVSVSSTIATESTCVRSKRKLFGLLPEQTPQDTTPSDHTTATVEPQFSAHTGTTPEFAQLTLNGSSTPLNSRRRSVRPSYKRRHLTSTITTTITTPTSLPRVRSLESDETSNKRPRCDNDIDQQQRIKDILATEAASSEHSGVIGDFSNQCSLPTIPGYHSDLNYITPQTLESLLNKSHTLDKKLMIVDCRYPYEFTEGHLQGAVNLYTKESVNKHLIESASDHLGEHTIIVFHCEFSSERGPKMCHFLRKQDRAVHTDSYPQLYYPEIYVLHGGYKAFYEQCGTEHCLPKSYCPMHKEEYHQEMKQCRQRTKMWGRFKSWHGSDLEARGRRISFSNDED